MQKREYVLALYEIYKKYGIDVYEESWEQLTRDKSFEGYMPEKVCRSSCKYR